MFRFPLCVLLVYDLCAPTLGIGMLGKSNMIFQRMEQCEPELHIIDFWVSQRKHNRSCDVLDLTLNSPYPIDDTVFVEMKGSIKKEGGYKPGALYFKDTACKVLNTILGNIFQDILHSIGQEECPLPAGEFAALDFYFDNEQFTVPQVYGEYKMEILMYKDDVLQTCLFLYYNFEPKDLAF